MDNETLEETREGQEGADQGTEQTTPETVVTEEAPGEGVPPAPELTLEQVQATPWFQELQGQRDRTKNLLRDSETSGEQARQQLTALQRQRDEELVGQLGDTQEVRDLVTRIRQNEELAANLSVREAKVRHLEYEELVGDLANEYGVDPEALRTADVKNALEMEVYAKALKSVAGTNQPETTPARLPALSHAPDAAVTTSSTAALGEAQIKDAYIAGDIDHAEYAARMKKIGKEP